MAAKSVQIFTERKYLFSINFCALLFIVGWILVECSGQFTNDTTVDCRNHPKLEWYFTETLYFPERVCDLQFECPPECACFLDKKCSVTTKCADYDLHNAIAYPSNITGLKLNHSGLHGVKEDAFICLDTIYFIDLSDNKLIDLHPRAFTSLNESLEVLHLDRNSITKLHPDLFQKMTKLAVISLNGNSLTELPDNVFNGADWTS